MSKCTHSPKVVCEPLIDPDEEADDTTSPWDLDNKELILALGGDARATRGSGRVFRRVDTRVQRWRYFVRRGRTGEYPVPRGVARGPRDGSGGEAMTGEDMIIEAAARVLRESRDDEHVGLRRVFWIAGRCEHCGAPHRNDGSMRCPSCKRIIVNRVSP